VVAGGVELVRANLPRQRPPLAAQAPAGRRRAAARAKALGRNACGRPAAGYWQLTALRVAARAGRARLSDS